MVDTNNHVLRGHGHRTTIRGLQNVVAREHQDAGLSLRFGAQRQVNRHLVTVEVSVKRGTNERVQVDGLTLNQLRLEGLDTQAVQRWCAVQQNRVLGDDLFENVPNNRVGALNHALGALDVLGVVQVDQALHDEGLEQLNSHFLRQTTLVQFELRTNNNYRTTRVVNTLTKQVLTETTLLTLEHVRNRLQGPVAGAGHRTTTTAVIEQRVHRFLQHALFVVDDNLRRPQIHEALETVIAVDDAAVQVVQVRGGETATIELNHGAQVRRNNRNRIQHHAQRRVIGGEERRSEERR